MNIVIAVDITNTGLQVSEDSTVCESTQSGASLQTSSIAVRMPVTATADETAALTYMAGAVGDDWPSIAQCLRLRSAQRRPELHAVDDQHSRLEVLASWFRSQPRAANKVSVVAF